MQAWRLFYMLVLATLSAMGSVGCAAHADVVKMRQELALAQKRQETLQQQLRTLGPRPDEQRKADIERMLKEAQRARQKVEELTTRLQSLEARLARLEIAQQRAAFQPNVPPGPIIREPKGPGRTPTTLEADLPPPRSPAITPTSAFNLAYNDYLNGQYQLAITGFQEFLEDFPSSSLAPNAHYWIGESYYSLKDYVRAIKAFEKVVNDFPRSGKVAPSLFKLGLASAEIGNSVRARVYLKRVIAEFSTSDEAQLAKHKLAEIR